MMRGIYVYTISSIIIASVFLTSVRFAAADTAVVSAAASLTNAFQTVGEAFEKEHPEENIRFNFDASGPLQRQIELGAPVDIFAAAGMKEMNALQRERRIISSTRFNFVSNSIVLITSPNSHIRSWRDLGKKGIGRIAISDPAAVPSGRYAEAVLKRKSLWKIVKPDLVLGENVRQTLAYVANGDVSAGVVFSTDAKQEGSRVRVAATAIPGKDIPVILYPIAITSASPHRRVAEEFLAFLRGTEAQQILKRYGFLPPSSSAAVTSAYATSSAERVSFNPLWISLQVTLMAMILTIPTGALLAWWLARGKPFRGKFLIETLFTLPLVLPPTAVGFLLALLLGHGTQFGLWLNNSLGIHLLFTRPGAAIAASVMALPLFLRTATAAFASVPQELLEAGKTMGAGRRDLAFYVTMPIAYRGLLAASTLAFARALGEFGATLMVAGNLPGITQTMPMAVYSSWLAGDNHAARLYVLLLTLTAFLLLGGVDAWQRRLNKTQGIM